jgi:adenylosuccinate synthase
VDLQAAGERLDHETHGRWVADELEQLITSSDPYLTGVVVDAILIAEQIAAVRRSSRGPVLHVHLTAPRRVLETRYASKRSGIEESDSYSVLLRSATESNVEQLTRQADLVFDTSLASVEDEVDVVERRLHHAN